MVALKFKKLHPDARLPSYESAGAAGMDVCLYCPNYGVPIQLLQGQSFKAGIGLAVEVPEGYEIQVRPRSGLAARGLTIANSPGTIDSDYRGEIKVLLIHHGGRIELNHGDRIAQLVLAAVPRAEIVEVEELSSTERGTGGLGSTGS